MQASPAWTPPTGTLGGIVAEARERALALHSRRAELVAAARDAGQRPSLDRAFSRDSVAVIAEVKRRSPSKGWIKAEISASEQARSYELGGASAISVLTEPAHFGGSIDDLISVRDAVQIPVLKKDFHVDTVQLVEAKAVGASAALLIVRALSPDELKRLAEAAAELELDTIIEIRDEDELERALGVDARFIGVNNRNLETLVIDPSTVERVLPRIPPNAIAIAESGMTTSADVERAAAFGADGVLVGSFVSGASDPTAAVNALTGIPRKRRVS